jgi:hypothetical protein
LIPDRSCILTVLDIRQTEIHASHRNCRNRPSRSCLLAPRVRRFAVVASLAVVGRVARTARHANSIACVRRGLACRRWAWPWAGEVTTRTRAPTIVYNFSWGFTRVRPSSVIQLGVTQSSVIQLGVHLSVHPRETRGRRMGVGIVTDHTHRNRAGGMSRLNRLVQALFMETPATMCGAIALRGLKRCR